VLIGSSLAKLSSLSPSVLQATSFDTVFHYHNLSLSLLRHTQGPIDSVCSYSGFGSLVSSLFVVVVVVAVVVAHNGHLPLPFAPFVPLNNHHHRRRVQPSRSFIRTAAGNGVQSNLDNVRVENTSLLYRKDERLGSSV